MDSLPEHPTWMLLTCENERDYAPTIDWFAELSIDLGRDAFGGEDDDYGDD